MLWFKKKVETIPKTLQEELNDITMRLNKLERDVFTAVSGQKDLTDKVLRKLRAQKEEIEEEESWNGIPKTQNINTKVSPFK